MIVVLIAIEEIFKLTARLYWIWEDFLIRIGKCIEWAILIFMHRLWPFIVYKFRGEHSDYV